MIGLSETPGILVNGLPNPGHDFIYYARFDAVTYRLSVEDEPLEAVIVIGDSARSRMLSMPCHVTLSA